MAAVFDCGTTWRSSIILNMQMRSNEFKGFVVIYLIFFYNFTNILVYNPNSVDPDQTLRLI